LLLTKNADKPAFHSNQHLNNLKSKPKAQPVVSVAFSVSLIFVMSKWIQKNNNNRKIEWLRDPRQVKIIMKTMLDNKSEAG
jgi:hypothetical protein